MTDNEKNISGGNRGEEKQDITEASTLFTDPEATAPKKTSKRRHNGKSTVAKQRIGIIIAVAVTAVVIVGFFVGSAIRRSNIELGTKWNSFKAAMKERLNDEQLANLTNYDTFADWLAEHCNDSSVKMLINESKDIRAILNSSPRLEELVTNISKEKKFANRIDDLVDDPEPAVKLLEGEVLGTGNSIYLYTPYSRKDIQSVKVKNQLGEYGFVYDDKAQDFFVEGYGDAPYNKELFSSLIVTSGKPTVIERVFDKCENFTEYELTDAQSPASFTVTSRSGESHTVYIGKMTVDGTGYYARYAGRDALYVLAASLESTVLADLEAMITPQLTFPMNESDNYTITDFTVSDRDGDRVILTFLEEEEKNEYGLESSFYMKHPAAYSVNSTNYSTVIQTLTNFTGLKTVKYSPTIEDLEPYGLSAEDYACKISYYYNDILQEVYFSEKNENGNYYALSLQFDLIAEVDGTSASWLEWDLIRWVDEPIFMMNINEIATVTVKSSEAERIFDLSGTDEELTVTERITGYTLPTVDNFRSFYRVLLSTNLQGYAASDLSEEELAQLHGSEPNMTLTVETRAGKIMVYRFYAYQTLRAYYTVDYMDDDIGERGEFYIMSASMQKIISDAEKVLTGETVDYEARN